VAAIPTDVWPESTVFVVTGIVRVLCLLLSAIDRYFVGDRSAGNEGQNMRSLQTCL
jgi:hypothetical protein